MPPVEDILAGGFVPVFLAQPLEWAYAAVQWMHPGWVPPSLSVAESYASLKSAVDTGNFWVMAWENLTTGQWASLAWGIEAGRLMQAPGLFLLGFVLGRQDFFCRMTERLCSGPADCCFPWPGPVHFTW